MNINLPFGISITTGKDRQPDDLTIYKADNFNAREAGKNAASALIQKTTHGGRSKVSAAPDKPAENKNSVRNNPSQQRLSNVDLNRAGGTASRASVDTTDSFTAFSMWNTFSKRKQRGRLGVSSHLDFDTFENLDFDYLSELLADLSPEVSNALWTFILMCNSGFEAKAYIPDSDEEHIEGTKAVSEMLSLLADYNGTIDVFFDRQFLMLFLRGSILQELVLQDNLKDFADIATPDTKTLEFRRVFDEVRGQVWDFGQRQNGKFVSLRLPNIKYVPVHPFPDSIEGRPLISPVLFPAIFLMAVLRDTKRVVQHQGYLRLDIEIIFKELIQTMPSDIEGNPEKILEWMDGITQAVKTAYDSLEPTDTYIHSDAVKINNPVGTVSADSLGAIDGLFKALERMCVRALKSMPILMAIDQSRSETQANREWEIYSKGIETIQHCVENAFSALAKLALQYKGIKADVKLRFETFRAAEKMRDVQYDILRAKLARLLYDNGIIGQEEQAQINGRKKADQGEPRSSGNVSFDGAGGGFGNQNPNEGEARSMELSRENWLRFSLEHPVLFERMLSSGLIEIGGEGLVRYTPLAEAADGSRAPSLTEIETADDFMKLYASDKAAELFAADVADEDDGSEEE